MPKFFVTVTRDTTESTTVDIVADSAAEAERLALEEATASPHNFDWAPDECSGGDPYIPAPGESAEIAEENCPHCGDDRPLGPDTGATWTCGGCNAFVDPTADA